MCTGRPKGESLSLHGSLIVQRGGVGERLRQPKPKRLFRAEEKGLQKAIQYDKMSFGSLL